MKPYAYLISLAIAGSSIAGLAQTQNVDLTIQVTSVDGDNLAGQKVELMQTDYSVGYGELTLDPSGKCTLKTFTGNHTLSVDRDGFLPASKDFRIADDAKTASVEIRL